MQKTLSNAASCEDWDQHLKTVDDWCKKTTPLVKSPIPQKHHPVASYIEYHAGVFWKFHHIGAHILCKLALHDLQYMNSSTRKNLLGQGTKTFLLKLSNENQILPSSFSLVDDLILQTHQFVPASSNGQNQEIFQRSIFKNPMLSLSWKALFPQAFQDTHQTLLRAFQDQDHLPYNNPTPQQIEAVKTQFATAKQSDPTQMPKNDQLALVGLRDAYLVSNRKEPLLQLLRSFSSFLNDSRLIPQTFDIPSTRSYAHHFLSPQGGLCDYFQEYGQNDLKATSRYEIIDQIGHYLKKNEFESLQNIAMGALKQDQAIAMGNFSTHFPKMISTMSTTLKQSPALSGLFLLEALLGVYCIERRMGNPFVLSAQPREKMTSMVDALMTNPAVGAFFYFSFFEHLLKVPPKEKNPRLLKEFLTPINHLKENLQKALLNEGVLTSAVLSKLEAYQLRTYVPELHDSQKVNPTNPKPTLRL